MDFLEQNLEDIVFNTPANKIISRGFTSYLNDAHTYRQLRLGNYGVCDIVQFSRSCEHLEECPGYYYTQHVIDVHVIELKKGDIDIDALIQAVRYCKGVLEYIEDVRGLECKVQFSVSLVGSKINTSDFVYMSELLQEDNFCLNFFTYKYDFDGISFKSDGGYRLTNSGLNKNLNYSKYVKTEPYVTRKVNTEILPF